MLAMDLSAPMIGVKIPLLAEGTKIPGADLLGPFPILQFLAGLVVLLTVAVGAMVWIKGKTSNEPLNAPRSNEAAVQLFFDGPLKAIFDYLVQIHSRQAQNRMEIRDEVAEIISDMRQQINNEIDNAKSELRGDINSVRQELNGKLDAISGLLNRMDGRSDNNRGR